MKQLLLCIWIVLGFPALGNAQPVKLQFHLVDSETEAPISDAHIFISDSSLGSTSDGNGHCELTVSAQETQILIITHLSYTPLFVAPEDYLKLVDGESIKLQRNSVEFNEVVLSAKRGNLWKKKYKRFKKALLGIGKEANQCEILNPEVLRFEEEKGALKATAVDLLQIENDYLGYDINFWLDELAIEADGSIFYKGNGQFIDQAATEDIRRIRRRDKIYQHSMAHLLRSLIQKPSKADLKELGYELTFEKYQEGAFIPIFIPQDPSALVQPDTATGWYRLYFSEFLTVRHKGVRVSADAGVQVSVSSREQQKFNVDRNQSFASGEQNAVSRLYKIEPYLLFDHRGNIINKSAVRDYGYWAEQRLAATLPVDYTPSLTLTKKQSSTKIDTLLIFQQLIGNDHEKKTAALKFLRDNWSESYIAPLLDILALTRDVWQQRVIKTLLREQVPSIIPDYYEGIQWLWKKQPTYGAFYADFKAYLYSALDPAFYDYFHKRGQQTTIRLDEIVWGGVVQDGIPPLRSPKMLSSAQATYLANSDVVFGLVIDGEARAYPKRILAWHEFFTDEIKDHSIAGVYCTLCGTVIIYDTEFNGVKHELGTSGFLYRSNKLMYDKATQSLWSTFLGKPVVGPLVGQDIELPAIPVETTTWGEWRGRYPDTQVLSLNTGHERNYDEGEAYKEYYATDNLMFPVPSLDKRLPNKARVFIPRPKNYVTDPLAISVKYLTRKKLHHDKIGDQNILIITESSGASRAYAINDQQFKSYKRGKLVDVNGEEWQVSEENLTSPDGQQLTRLPAHEAFWFAWVNVFPDTRIVR
ncbi:MAG: DUF3179 domain-containing protein [Bacteroidetes bacterium]|nr:MAG: DUF3179 domain-containing protein [Bacteroidota bacterium]